MSQVGHGSDVLPMKHPDVRKCWCDETRISAFSCEAVVVGKTIKLRLLGMADSMYNVSSSMRHQCIYMRIHALHQPQANITRLVAVLG